MDEALDVVVPLDDESEPEVLVLAPVEDEEDDEDRLSVL